MTESGMNRKDAVREYFLTQARYCKELDSPFMVRLCSLFADKLDHDNTIAEQLAGLPFTGNFWSIAMPLRIAGALHALVLTGQCERLASVYPPRHDQADDEALWAAVSHAMASHEDFIIPFLESAPQTNEVRRSAALLPGFLTIASRTGLPFTLSELGASAGINQCWDSFGYRLDGHDWGDTESGVMMEPAWKGNPPPDMVPIEVINRTACDISPVDYKDPQSRLRLLAYIWADQEDRFTRTEKALEILAGKEYPVEKANISDWLPDRLAKDHDGSVHVIYHTIVWNYQGEEACESNRKVLEEAGAKATADSPLAWLRLEPDGKDPGAAILLTMWPDGEERCLGRADYHGRWIDWTGWR